MYFPPGFDKSRAVELGNLVNQAYERFENFKTSLPWSIKGGYGLVCEVEYRTLFSFDAADEENLTAIDREMMDLPVAFSLDSLIGQDIPIGFVAHKDKTAYLIFRGTVTGREWLFDVSIKQVPYRIKKWGKVSNGFQSIYNRSRESFIKKLNALEECEQLFISGHSLGGALSLLALPDVVKSTHFKAPILYNFGCPRVGDDAFVKAYNALPGQRTFRIVNTCDLATAVPLPVQVPALPSGPYSHVDEPVDFTFQGNSLSANHAMEMYVAALS